MGTPVNCPEAGILLNSGFDSEEFWQIIDYWQIHNSVAELEGTGEMVNAWLLQNTNLVIGQTYVIDFDVLDITVTGATHLQIRLGGVGAATSGPITTPGHKRVILIYDSYIERVVFEMIVANADYRHIKIDNAVCGTLETFIACAMNFANLPNTNFEFFDLGGGIYMVFYADPAGTTKLWCKIDINDF